MDSYINIRVSYNIDMIKTCHKKISLYRERDNSKTNLLKNILYNIQFNIYFKTKMFWICSMHKIK